MVRFDTSFTSPSRPNDLRDRRQWMGGFFGRLVREARRTAQPYAFTLRAAVAYVGVAIFILVLLSLVRITFLAPPSALRSQEAPSDFSQPASVTERSAFGIAEDAL